MPSMWKIDRSNEIKDARRVPGVRPQDIYEAEGLYEAARSFGTARTMVQLEQVALIVTIRSAFSIVI
jgi:hypothetical protein